MSCASDEPRTAPLETVVTTCFASDCEPAMTATSLFRCFLFAVLTLGMSASARPQTSTNLQPTQVPPEFSGPPAQKPTISSTDERYAEAFVSLLKDLKLKDTDLPRLDAFIREYPQNDVAYFWRGTVEACALTPPRLQNAERDLQMYETKEHTDLFPSQENQVLPLLAKIELSEDNAPSALLLMKRAAIADIDQADSIFNAQGVKPETTADFCTWSLQTLNQLVSAAPHDPWPQMLLGLYYQFFARFDEAYFPQAATAFRKAALLDPRNHFIPYLQGKLYDQATFLETKRWATTAARLGETNVAMYTKAVSLDPTFAKGFTSRAEAYLSGKQPALAIKDFTRALALDPKNTTALTDRGNAEVDIARYYDAIQDFSESLRQKSDNDSYLPQLYENRANAYLKVHDPRRAVPDFSDAIRLRLKTLIPVLTLPEFRALYPEFRAVSDDALLNTLQGLFAPQFDPAVFRKMILENKGKFGISLLNDLYESRGDTLLSIGDYVGGIRDFQRIYDGIPNFADSTERWRSLGTTGHGDKLYLDAKGSNVAPGESPRIWLKLVAPKRTTVLAFAVDCHNRRVRTTSTTLYDSQGNILEKGPAGDWTDLTPDTLGEQIWTGVCKASS